jgi:TPR repeat/Peptidase_C39 like family
MLACRVLLAIWLAAMAGCASVPFHEPSVSPALASRLPQQVKLTAVPFHPQEPYQCGPAALATVLGYAGIERSVPSLVDDVYVPKRQGSLPTEMLAATRRAGALPYELTPTLDALLQEIAAGHPVVVLQNMRWEFWPQWHYAVVVGYDLSRRTLVLRSDTEARLQMPLADFDDSWRKAQRWAFVVMPLQELPATANESDYVKAAASLELVSPMMAQRAYETALRQWPDSALARIGLGNTYYKMGQLDAAGQAYRQVTQDHPQSADAWNNLAQVLFEQGQASQAWGAAQHAVALGGTRLTTYQTTLDQIERQQARAIRTPSSP